MSEMTGAIPNIEFFYPAQSGKFNPKLIRKGFGPLPRLLLKIFVN